MIVPAGKNSIKNREKPMLMKNMGVAILVMAAAVCAFAQEANVGDKAACGYEVYPVP